MNAAIRAHNLAGAASLAAFAGNLYSVMAERARSMHDIYGETKVRKSYRQLIDAAGQIEGTELKVTFLKNDNTIREMHCRSIGPDSDYTKRYVTVFDIEKDNFRRVALDSILDIQITAGVTA